MSTITPASPALVALRDSDKNECKVVPGTARVKLGINQDAIYSDFYVELDHELDHERECMVIADGPLGEVVVLAVNVLERVALPLVNQVNEDLEFIVKGSDEFTSLEGHRASRRVLYRRNGVN